MLGLVVGAEDDLAVVRPRARRECRWIALPVSCSGL